jgi:hypothetical protein
MKLASKAELKRFIFLHSAPQTTQVEGSRFPALMSLNFTHRFNGSNLNVVAITLPSLLSHAGIRDVVTILIYNLRVTTALRPLECRRKVTAGADSSANTVRFCTIQSTAQSAFTDRF